MKNIIKEKILEINFIYKILIYAALGVLWSLSQVGYSFGFLTWFSFVPIIFFMKYEKFKRGLFLSWIFGFSAYLAHFWWMVQPVAMMLNQINGFNGGLQVIGWGAGIFIYLSITAFQGIMYMIIFFLAKIIARRNGSFFYLILPVVVTVVDVFFPKLWMDRIGYSQFIFFHFSQIADIFGVPGITFLVVATNASIILLIEAILFRENMLKNIILFISVIFIIILSSVYGVFRVKQITNLSAKAPTANIGVVQGNYSGLDKRQISWFQMKDRYIELTNKLIENNKTPIDLIVWPESALMVRFEANRKEYPIFDELKPVNLLFGSHLEEIDNNKNINKIYNSLILLSPQKKTINFYEKQKLLPFVEGAPFGLNFILHKVGIHEFGRGKQNKIMSIKNDTIKFATNICYEDIMPDLIRKSLTVNGKKANLIINATNDSWFGKTIEPLMHLHLAGFRSIENRRALVRSTCTGYSAFYNPLGAYEKYKNSQFPSSLFKEYSAVYKVPLLEINTIYNQWGWFFKWILLIITILLFGVVIYRKIRFLYIKTDVLKRLHHKKKLFNTWMN